MKILKIVRHKNQYYTQTFFVFDEIPRITYEKIGADYVGSAYLPSGKVLFSYYLQKKSWKGAFAGRPLTLPMKDGTTVEIKDWWYDAGPYPAHGMFCDIGAGTVEELQRCYVYSGMYIAKEALQEMMDEYYTRDRDYTYKEVEDWVNLQYTWYPVVVDGKKTTLLVNKNGGFIDSQTKKRVHVQTNIWRIRYKAKGKTDKEFRFCFFDWERMENGRLIKDRRKMVDILKASLPVDIYEARLQEMKRGNLI